MNRIRLELDENSSLHGALTVIYVAGDLVNVSIKDFLVLDVLVQ